MNTLRPVDTNDIYKETILNREQDATSYQALSDWGEPEEDNQLQGSQKPAPAIAKEGPTPMVDRIANKLSDQGEKEKKELEDPSYFDRAVSYMADVGAATLRPLTALGDAALAPIAADDYPDGFIASTGHAFAISGKALMNGLFPTIGEESPDYARQIVEREFGGLSPTVRGMLSTTIGMVSDPTFTLGIGAAKIYQAGIQAKRLQSAGKLEPTNRGIWEEGLSELMGLTGVKDEKTLTNIGHLAAKADRGDKQAVQELSEVISDSRLQKAANDLDVVATANVVKQYKDLLGDTSKPLLEIDANVQLTKAAIKAGIIKNEPIHKAFNINLARLGTEKDVDLLLKGITDYYGDMFKANVGKRTIPEVKAGGQQMLLKDLIGRNPANFSDAQAFGLRQGLTTVASMTQKAMITAKTTKLPLDILRAQELFKLNTHLMMKVSGVASEWGRLGRSLSVEAGSNRKMYSQIKDLWQDAAKNDELTKIMRSMDLENLDPAQFSKFLDKGTRGFIRKGYDAVYEAYVNAILSGPITHAVNMTSNTAMLMLRPTEQYIASLSAVAKFDMKGANSHFKQANAQVAGLAGGVSDLFKLATGMANKSDIRYPEQLNKMHELAKQKVRPQISSANFRLTGTPGRIVDLIGAVIRAPGNALLAEDKAFKMLNYRMTVNQEAAKKAADLAVSSDDARAVYTQLRNNPDEYMEEAAEDMANLYTFTNKLEGTLGDWERALRIPIVNLFVPFFRTPVNITKFGLNYSVVGNLKNDLLTGKMFKSTADGNLSAARFSIGTLLPVSIVASMGDDITGAQDMSTEEGRRRAELRPAYSIKVGDKWVSYARVEPLKTILGMFTNYKEIMNYTDVKSKSGLETAALMGGTIVQAVAQAVGDNAFFDTFGNIHYMLEGATSGNMDAFSNRLEKMGAAMLVPNLVSQTNRSSMDEYFRMADSFFDQLKKRTWGLSQDLPIYPNAFGEPQHVPRGVGLSFVNPFLTMDVNNDKLSKMFVDLDVPIPNLVPEEISYNGIPIELSIYQRSTLGQLVGLGVKGAEDGSNYMPPVREVLEKMTSSDKWDYWTDDIKRDRIVRVYQHRKESIVNYLMKADPELSEQYLFKRTAKEQERAEAMAEAQAKANGVAR